MAEKLNLLSGPDLISVTTTSSTLATLLSATLNKSLKQLTLIPVGAGIYWKQGTVTSNDAELPSNGISIACKKDVADKLQFIVASGTIDMQVLQEG